MMPLPPPSLRVCPQLGEQILRSGWLCLPGRAKALCALVGGPALLASGSSDFKSPLLALLVSTPSTACDHNTALTVNSHIVFTAHMHAILAHLCLWLARTRLV